MKVWLKVLVSGGLLALLFILLPWEEVRGAFLRLPPGTWFIVLAGFVAGHSVGVAKWRLFVNAGHAALRARDAVQCYAAGLFANLCLPSIVGGDVLRAAMAARITRRPEAAFLGGVIDRITDMVAMVILVALGGALSRTTVPGWGAQAIAVALVLGAIVTAIGAPLILRLPVSRWPRRLRRPVGRSLVALRRLARNPGAATAALGLSLTIQGSFVLLNRMLGHAIGIEVPVAVWFLVWPLAKIASLMPISLGGLAV
ncbi:MAG: flippase-like domain-containing protein, partial [Gammaproteobacteria bacterium]|nr:flippase-like domain-containing protein [Gammaproteobacteria bacterium]